MQNDSHAVIHKRKQPKGSDWLPVRHVYRYDNGLPCLNIEDTRTENKPQ